MYVIFLHVFTHGEPRFIVSSKILLQSLHRINSGEISGQVQSLASNGNPSSLVTSLDHTFESEQSCPVPSTLLILIITNYDNATQITPFLKKSPQVKHEYFSREHNNTVYIFSTKMPFLKQHHKQINHFFHMKMEGGKWRKDYGIVLMPLNCAIKTLPIAVSFFIICYNKKPIFNQLC